MGFLEGVPYLGLLGYVKRVDVPPLGFFVTRITRLEDNHKL